MFQANFIRQIQAQHDAVMGPFKETMDRFEAMVAPLKKMMEPYELLSRQMQATIESVVGPKVDYEKMFGGAGFTVKAIEDMIGPRMTFDLPPGLPDMSFEYDRLRETFEQRQREDAERARQSHDVLMESLASSQRAADARDRWRARLIAEELVKKLREPNEEEPVQGEEIPAKRKIGFGDPEE